MTPTRRPGNGQPGPQRAQASRQPAARAREAAAVPDGPVIRPAPLWFQLTTWVLAAGGLGGSIYLTIAHYNTTVTLACPATSHINCERVTTSPESIVFGIPVAVLGLGEADEPDLAGEEGLVQENKLPRGVVEPHGVRPGALHQLTCAETGCS